ncbi:hypothetical protein M9458_028971, partial [Cirrhinus mrigala]
PVEPPSLVRSHEPAAPPWPSMLRHLGSALGPHLFLALSQSVVSLVGLHHGFSLPRLRSGSTLGSPSIISALVSPASASILASPASNSALASPASASTLGPPSIISTLASPASTSILASPTFNSALAPLASTSTLGSPSFISTLAPPDSVSALASPTISSSLGPPIISVVVPSVSLPPLGYASLPLHDHLLSPSLPPLLDLRSTAQSLLEVGDDVMCMSCSVLFVLF